MFSSSPILMNFIYKLKLSIWFSYSPGDAKSSASLYTSGKSNIKHNLGEEKRIASINWPGTQGDTAISALKNYMSLILRGQWEKFYCHGSSRDLVSILLIIERQVPTTSLHMLMDSIPSLIINFSHLKVSVCLSNTVQRYCCVLMEPGLCPNRNMFLYCFNIVSPWSHIPSSPLATVESDVWNLWEVMDINMPISYNQRNKDTDRLCAQSHTEFCLHHWYWIQQKSVYIFEYNNYCLNMIFFWEKSLNYIEQMKCSQHSEYIKSLHALCILLYIFVFKCIEIQRKNS